MYKPTVTDLEAKVGKHISAICTCSYSADADNHCAHFTSHITQLQIGFTCFGMTGKGDKTTAASIRVHEVFAKCGRVGLWTAKPADITSGYIFVTKASNVTVATKVMANVRRKHIGIFIGNDVWQYKNAFKQVVKQTPDVFKKHYTDVGTEIFFGEFPIV